MVVGEKTEGGQATGPNSTVRDVLAIEPVIRRVVAARVTNRDDVDDLVHDCLERLLVARDRLAPETVLPFGIVTAQNLVTSQARSAARRADRAHRLVDRHEPERPEDSVLAGETRRAMAAALARLSPQEQRDLLAYQEHGTRHPGGSAPPESPGAMRVRMARTRAKLRLEYLLALRRVTLPSPVCRRVLLSISGGDARRQRALAAGDHLLDCETCAILAEPLEKRSLALTVVTFPIVLATWVLTKARAHPVTAAGATAAAVAAAVAGSSVFGSAPPRTRPAAAPAGTSPRTGPSPSVPTTSVPLPTRRPVPPSAGAIVWLKVDGHEVDGLKVDGPGVDGSTQGDSPLHAARGRRIEATDVRVEQVVTHDGFWVGPDQGSRVWVELVGPLRQMHMVRGDRLRFVGRVVADDPSYPARAGLTAETGARLLAHEGAHIAVLTTAVRVEGRTQTT